jgi:hypothetical protein
MNMIEAYEAEIPRGIDLFFGQTQFYPNIEKYLKKQYADSKKFLKGMSLESRVEYICTVPVQDPYRVGVYTAFKNNDMELLNNVIYLSACMCHIDAVSGYDHGAFAYELLPLLFSARLFDRVKLAVPEEIGMSHNGYTKVSSTIVNLIMALLYKRDDFAVYAKKCAEECLTKKQTISEKSMLCFLLALCDKDSSEASAQLAEICRGTSKNKEPYTTPFDRMLSLQAIGMYNFAVYIEPDFAKKIDLPNNQNFCRSFISWQLQHRDYTGKPFIHYDAPLDFYNTVLTTIPPAITLCEDHGKPFKCLSVDIKKFRYELIQRILKNHEDTSHVL